MLANVFTKTVRDRWKGEAIAAVTMAAMLLFGMAVYKDIDLSVYTDLPAALRSLIGICGHGRRRQPRLRRHLRLVRRPRAGRPGDLHGLRVRSPARSARAPSACCSATPRAAPRCSSRRRGRWCC